MVKGLGKLTRWCDAYKQVDYECKNFLNTVPLIQALGSKAMRPRHWMMLITLTGKDFVPPYDNPKLLLSEVYSYHLLISDGHRSTLRQSCHCR